MKRMFQWMMAAILICGQTLFTACSNNGDNPVMPDPDIVENIIGKWASAETDGRTTPTNKRRVITIVSDTKAYYSASRGPRTDSDGTWIDESEGDVVIRGNKVILTIYPDEQSMIVDEFIITAIDGNEFTANHKITVTENGKVRHTDENVVRYTKVTADFSEAIVGLWECQEIIGSETNNDDNGRLEFLADGTYRFYVKDDAGVWNLVPREQNEYFVDGNFLATRWQPEGGAMICEWWEIATVLGDKMLWTALRQNEDGTVFEQGVLWEKVDLNDDSTTFNAAIEM